MGDGTGIEWTDETWNPIRGCRRTAPTGSTQSGCGDATGGGCYAEAQAERIVRMGKGKPTAYDGLVRLVGGKPRWTGEVSFDSERLAAPLRWRKGRRIFVNSMSDLFYERFSNEQIAAVFGVMAACPQHTFQILTKRARRMREWFEWVGSHPDEGPRSNGAAMFCARRAFDQLEWDPRLPPVDDPSVWPLRNAWIGVSVENQAAAIERIPDLLLTPAAVRFLSCEPLLGPVDLSQWTAGPEPRFPGDDDGDRVCRVCGLAWPDVRETLEPHACPPGFGALHWIIAGCESGPGARPCEVTWLRSMRSGRGGKRT